MHSGSWAVFGRGTVAVLVRRESAAFFLHLLYVICYSVWQMLKWHFRHIYDVTSCHTEIYAYLSLSSLNSCERVLNFAVAVFFLFFLIKTFTPSPLFWRTKKKKRINFSSLYEYFLLINRVHPITKPTKIGMFWNTSRHIMCLNTGVKTHGDFFAMRVLFSGCTELNASRTANFAG